MHRASRTACVSLSVFALMLLGALKPAAAVTHDVSVGPAFVFTPANIMINVGDTVLWTWMGGLHNVESGVGGTPDGIFNSGTPTITVGTTFSVVFDQAFLNANPVPGNTYNYYCFIHFGFGQTGSIIVTGVVTPETFVRSDCNDDGGRDIADVIFELGYLFGSGASSVNCEDACDCNDDGALDIGDAIFDLSALFSGGSPPPPPLPGCGADPTADARDCALFNSCP